MINASRRITTVAVLENSDNYMFIFFFSNKSTTYIVFSEWKTYIQELQNIAD